ncbi:MAG: long-chain fatty acid--CoA ligase [Nitrospirae bacterium]|nr:long-chain fatty acid--CoA ligase [Nitrospirota bacterium]MBI3595393.1 long-chain fatty acid--CoA ligase [Nitrospirota bacterium]
MMNERWLKRYDPDVSPDLKIPSIPLHEILRESAKRFPNHQAMYFYGKSVTYAELDEQSNRFGNVLKSFGVKRGDRVTIMLPNTPHCVIAYYAILKIGAVVVQTNPLYVERELEHQLKDSGSEIIVALDLFYPRIKGVMERTRLKKIIICRVTDFLPPLLKLLYPLKALKEGQRVKVDKESFIGDFIPLSRGASHLLDHQVIPPDEIALLQYTGGTTGTAKGVMLTHSNLVTNTLQCRSWMPDLKPGEETFLAVIPFFHVFGMTACMNLAIVLGAKMILIPKFKTEEVIKNIEKSRATVFLGVQAMYVAINHFEGIEKRDISSIKVCISGGGPLHVEVQEQFESLTGGKLVEGFGLTEASPVTHCNPINGIRKKGAIGLPLPLTEARIVDLETGEKEMPVGEAGELIVKGPQVMKGYWNHPEETRQTLRNGWLFTGDMARMDEEGFFFIVDRKKDMIKTVGENVYPREVEEILFQFPKVKEAVVVGLPDSFSVEIIKAYLVLNEGTTATEDEIITFCRTHLAKFKVPKMVEFRKELPKTIVGKVLRRVLLEEELMKTKLNQGKSL